MAISGQTVNAEFRRLMEQNARQLQHDAMTGGIVTYNPTFDDREAIINKMAMERAGRIPEYENRMRAKMIEVESQLRNPEPEPNKVLLLL